MSTTSKQDEGRGPHMALMVGLYVLIAAGVLIGIGMLGGVATGAVRFVNWLIEVLS